MPRDDLRRTLDAMRIALLNARQEIERSTQGSDIIDLIDAALRDCGTALKETA